MQYRKDKYGHSVSALGYGCMRFSRKGTGIDLEKTEREIMEAYHSGINYFDTAYIYPGSEDVLGKILEKNGIRDDVLIATKLPQYLITNRKAIDRYFDEELQRLRTDHVDYYLMHMLTDIRAWQKLDRLGIRDWIEEQKNSGRIRNIGFSYHGTTEMFKQIIDAYDWDFCQIQYNYMDEHTQAGREGLQYAAEKGIPVVIMEPLRGGKLVNLLPEKAKQIIKDAEPKRTPAEIAFRWLFDQPEVAVVLSGMNSIEMVKENCRIADESHVGCVSEEDRKLYEAVKEEIRRSVKIGCTECRYCMPCPKGVSIPDIFRAYNRMYTENRWAGIQDYAMTVALRKDPGFASKCVNCHACEHHCPQHLEIPVLLKEAEKKLAPLHVKAVLSIARKHMNRR